MVERWLHGEDPVPARWHFSRSSDLIPHIPNQSKKWPRGSSLHNFPGSQEDVASVSHQKTNLDELASSSHSSMSETSSVASRVFSNESAASNRSSLTSEVHEGLFEQCVRAIIEVTAIKDICSEGVRSIDRARFERNIRRLLQDYAYQLRKLPRSQPEHATIKYFRRHVSQVAETFTNTFYPPDLQQPTTRRKVNQRQEETNAVDDDDSDIDSDDDQDTAGENHHLPYEAVQAFIVRRKEFVDFLMALEAFVDKPRSNHYHRFPFCDGCSLNDPKSMPSNTLLHYCAFSKSWRCPFTHRPVQIFKSFTDLASHLAAHHDIHGDVFLCSAETCKGADRFWCHLDRFVLHCQRFHADQDDAALVRSSRCCSGVGEKQRKQHGTLGAEKPSDLAEVGSVFVRPSEQ